MRKLASALLATLALASVTCPAGAEPAGQVVIDFADDDVAERISNLSTASEIVDVDGRKMLEVTYESTGNRWPHVAVAGPWDLSAYTGIEAEVTNLSDATFAVACRVDNPGATGRAKHSSGGVTVMPGQTATLHVRFNRNLHPELRENIQGMQWLPDLTREGAWLDPSNVVKIQFFMGRPAWPLKVRIGNVRAVGQFDPERAKNMPQPFLPFIDKYGQYIHRDWPGKTKTDADLAAARAAEQKDLAAHPGPKHWNKYGGWTAGPTLEATGHFRVAQHDGKWWLVDPEGKLFWSWGIDCVGTGRGATFIEGGRDGWFAELPEPDSPLARFFGQKQAKRGDYRNQTLKTFGFGGANLYRKYGADYREIALDLAHKRLRSWGVNTLGCWSRPETFELRRTPYTWWIYRDSKRIYDWSLLRKPFPDVYDPAFEKDLRKRAETFTKSSRDDPYCIGYFVDNELPWGDKTTIAAAALKSLDDDQPIKMALVADLQDKYENDIAKLNAAWKSDFATWDDVGRRKGKQPAFVPATSAGIADLAAFTEKTTHRYFRIVRDVVKQIAPQKLYLGCRFSQYNPQVVRICNQYVDVISFNRYRRTVGGWKPPVKIDKPIIIGEFHFGAQDRGPFGPGLRGVADQQARGEALKRYVADAAAHPLLIGAHWFQYYDEATAGRTLEGENHQIGFLDICDRPYPETVAASREVGGKLYEIRNGVSATIPQLQPPTTPADEATAARAAGPPARVRFAERNTPPPAAPAKRQAKSQQGRKRKAKAPAAEQAVDLNSLKGKSVVDGLAALAFQPGLGLPMEGSGVTVAAEGDSLTISATSKNRCVGATLPEAITLAQPGDFVKITCRVRLVDPPDRGAVRIGMTAGEEAACRGSMVELNLANRNKSGMMRSVTGGDFHNLGRFAAGPLGGKPAELTFALVRNENGLLLVAGGGLVPGRAQVLDASPPTLRFETLTIAMTGPNQGPMTIEALEIVTDVQPD